jgi:undecaprenyl-phosphate 4-deoxy-4-formamido-L-arabinose transferase
MSAHNLNLSLIIPVFNSENSLAKLIESIVNSLSKTSFSYEIVCINDGSIDRSYQVLQELALITPSLRAINLTKNFGQDNAIMAGLNNCYGDNIVIMDDDLQHHPNDISLLIDGLNPDFDVCYGLYAKRKGGILKSLASKFNNFSASIILKKPRKLYLSPFKAFKSNIKDEIIKYKSPYPYVDGLILRITANINQVIVNHHTREVGESGYTFTKSLKIWLNLSTSFSIMPLRISTIIGFISSLSSFILAIYFYVEYLIGMPAPTGWQSTILIILFLGGIQLMTLGVIGEYLGRLYLSQSNLPQFAIREATEQSE